MADNEKLLKCETCGKCFSRKNTLDEHVKNRLCQKPFECTECDETFAKKFQLSVHVKSVHGEENKKTFECLLCPEVFPSKYYLKIHMGDHDPKQLFKCETCRKYFGLKSNLDEHMKTTHLGQKLYQCHQCGKTFTRKYYLAFHIKSGHNQNSTVLRKCRICSKQFKNKTSLKLHEKEHSTPECLLCFQSIQQCTCSWNPEDDQYTRLKNRFARENLMIRCQKCTKPILRISQLKMHLRIHRDYKCILCDEDYKDCRCSDDYLEVSETINTYEKTGRPSAAFGEVLTRKTPDPPVEDEKKLFEIKDDNYNNYCSDDYMHATKRLKTYQRTVKPSTAGKVLEPAVRVKEEEIDTPTNESDTKDVKELIEIKETMIMPVSCNEDDSKCNIYCSDDYMKPTKSIRTYQRTNKSSTNAPVVKVKEEDICVPVDDFVSKFEEKSVESTKIIEPKIEPKEEYFEIGDGSVEACAEINVDATKKESIEI